MVSVRGNWEIERSRYTNGPMKYTVLIYEQTTLEKKAHKYNKYRYKYSLKSCSISGRFPRRLLLSIPLSYIHTHTPVYKHTRMYMYYVHISVYIFIFPSSSFFVLPFLSPFPSPLPLLFLLFLLLIVPCSYLIYIIACLIF